MANNNLATFVQKWARESLMVLHENIVAPFLVNRQFQNELAREGQTVNAHRPGEREAKTRTSAPGDSFTAEDAETANVPVTLDQWIYDSFIISDDEMSMSFVDLRRLHLVPSAQALARSVDRRLLGRIYSFLSEGDPTKRAGKLGGITAANSNDYLLEADQILNENRAPANDRSVIISPAARAAFLKNELFVAADKSGGNTLRNGELGTLYNSPVFMAQNVNNPSILNMSTEDKAINNMAGYPAGHAGSITVDAFSHTLVVGEYFTIASNAQPQWITVTNGSTTLTLNEALKFAAADGDAVTVYFAVTNEATERAAGYAKDMTFTVASGKHLKVGQLLSFGTTSGTRHTYTIVRADVVDATHTKVWLNRPLAATVASGAAAFPGPAGGMNWLLHRDALTLVTRPLWRPDAALGVASEVVELDGIGIRVTMQYHNDQGGVRVNTDLLGGIAVLDDRLAVPILS